MSQTRIVADWQCVDGYSRLPCSAKLYVMIQFTCDNLRKLQNNDYTLSIRIGKVVASHAEVARSFPGWAETAPIYTMHEALMGNWPLWWGVRPDN